MKKAKDLIIGCEHDGSYIPVNEVLKLIKLAQIDAIEETCRRCSTDANLVINNLSCTDKDYNDYYQCGDDEISVNRQLILSVADKLKKEL